MFSPNKNKTKKTSQIMSSISFFEFNQLADIKVTFLLAAWKMPINITQESYDKVKQVGQGPNSIRKYKKPRLDGPLLNKDPHLLGLDEPIVVSNPDPPPPDKQPRILFSGINPRKHAKVMHALTRLADAVKSSDCRLSLYQTVKGIAVCSN